MEVTSLTSWGMNHMKRIRRVRESGAGRREGQLEIILCPTEEEIGGAFRDLYATAMSLRDSRIYLLTSAASLVPQGGSRTPSRLCWRRRASRPRRCARRGCRGGPHRRGNKAVNGASYGR